MPRVSRPLSAAAGQTGSAALSTGHCPVGLAGFAGHDPTSLSGGMQPGCPVARLLTLVTNEFVDSDIGLPG